MNPRSSIPPLNPHFQENYLTRHPMYSQPTGEESTPLRWLLDTLEKIFFVETLTDANDAETISDPEASCPVCLETYRKPREEMARPETGQASRLIRNERPLKLDCGHVIGRTCLRRMINVGNGGEPKCPLCRDWIHTAVSVIPLARTSDRKHDTVALLCCVIRLYILFNPNRPETHEGLYEWVHRPTFVGRTLEEEDIFAKMKIAVDKWEDTGKQNMWRQILLRQRGLLPNEELGTVDGGSEGMGPTYTPLLNSSTPVLQRDDMSDI